MSEIDDIFASKGKSQVPKPIASGSTSLPPVKTKKKKGKKRKREVESEDDAQVLYRKPRPAPQTIIDPSILISSMQNPKVDRATETTRPKVSTSKAQDIDEDKFKDSRGFGPRRKTAEGWLIYKEDELGIRDEGGDTPLCPFDCDCCF